VRFVRHGELDLRPDDLKINRFINLSSPTSLLSLRTLYTGVLVINGTSVVCSLWP